MKWVEQRICNIDNHHHQSLEMLYRCSSCKSCQLFPRDINIITNNNGGDNDEETGCELCCFCLEPNQLSQQWPTSFAKSDEDDN